MSTYDEYAPIDDRTLEGWGDQAGDGLKDSEEKIKDHLKFGMKHAAIAYSNLEIAGQIFHVSEMLRIMLQRMPTPRQDKVAEFGPFAARHVARKGEVSAEEMAALYEDFHGIELKKEETGE